MRMPDKHDPVAEAEALLRAGEPARDVELSPSSEAARLALDSAWLEAGEAERAVQILADIPSTSYLAPQAAAKIAAADAIRRANRSAPGYVRHLFDQFAPDYDRRM